MNPSQSKVVSANQTPLPNNNNSNNPVAYNPQGYNTFDRSAPHLSTYRFAEAAPFYCVPEIEGNVARIRTAHDLRTETLSSVLLTKVKQDKSFYQIPWSAIAPHTWEYLYRQPIKGDDIDFLSVFPRCSMQLLCNSLRSFLSSCVALTTIPDYKLVDFLSRYIPTVITCNLVFGNASLFHRLGTSTPNENLCDDLRSNLVSIIENCLLAGISFKFVDPDNNDHLLSTYEFDGLISQSSLSDICQWLDDFEFYSMWLAVRPTNFTVFQADLSSSVVTFSNYSNEGYDFVKSLIIDALPKFLLDWYSAPSGVPVNLMPCIAYQLVCAQYYSNSSVDDYYTGKQYLENLLSLHYSIDEQDNPYHSFYNHLGSAHPSIVDLLRSSFTVNGVRVQYDAFSGRYMTILGNIISGIFDSVSSPSLELYLSVLAFFSPLFSIQRSLKYGDYFVSARTQPLSTGSSEIIVSSNRVNVVDVNKALWVQRFRNAVNRIPQTISEYLRQLTGVEPERLAPQPNWICTESYTIGGLEVENTAQDQGKVTTLLRSEESRYMYEVFVDEPSFIIGIRSFVSTNIYPKSSSKISFMSDRLDWFNHFAQHFGDESVELRELLVPRNPNNYVDTPISYHIRYSGFKYGIPRASGAFSKGLLPSWAVMPRYDSTDKNDIPVMSSHFIRNRNSDFDVLFASMLGTNNASRYHFIISDYIDDNVNSRQAKFPSLDV